jgi:hypothetical protein
LLFIGELHQSGKASSDTGNPRKATSTKRLYRWPVDGDLTVAVSETSGESKNSTAVSSGATSLHAKLLACL